MNEVYVEKFGGASVNSAESIKNVVAILQSNEKVRVVVVSAMGKTTNALEKIVDLWHRYNKFNEEEFTLTKEYHTKIVRELFEKTTTTRIRKCKKTIRNTN